MLGLGQRTVMLVAVAKFKFKFKFYLASKIIKNNTHDRHWRSRERICCLSCQCITVGYVVAAVAKK